jgi:hypothetical protein
MRYEARITAYDVMDSVQIVVVVWETDEDPTTPNTPVVRSVQTVPGTGESDPYQWTRDVLVAALEDL